MLGSVGSLAWLVGGCFSASPVAPADPPTKATVKADSAGHVISVVAPPRAVVFPAPIHARRADDLVGSIGVNIHLGYFGSPYGGGYQAIVRPMLIASGIRHLRDAGTVLPDDAWMQAVYGRMNDLAGAGLKFSLIMLPAQGATVYDRLTEFNRFVQYAGNAVEAVEGLNEHDLSRRPEWVTEVRSFQAALYSAVKGDPRTNGWTIYGPSLGRSASAAQVGDLSNLLDYANLHPYPGGKEPLANLADHRTRGIAMNGNRPVVVTETGYHTALAAVDEHPPVSERAMGRYVGRMVFEYFAVGIARTYFYEFIDEGTSQTNREQNFGLVRHDGTPKPAYTVIKNLIGVLADKGPLFSPGAMTYALTGDTTGVKQLLLRKRDGRFYLVLWQAVRSYDLATKTDVNPPDRAVTVQLDRPAARVRLFSPLGSETPIADRNQATSVPVQVPDSPVILEVTP